MKLPFDYLKQRIGLISLLIFSLLLYVGCKKESPIQTIGGSIHLNVLVKHHNRSLNAIPVYLKADTNFFPGREPALYDLKSQTDASGNANFSKLFPGNYYVYAYGWDPGVLDSVWGNKGIVLNNQT